MTRILRIDKANLIYHTLNRANARVCIFNTDYDYKAFENILEDAYERVGIRLYSYVIMPNHWHFVVSPERDGDLSSFFGWLTLTHTQRYRKFTNTVGEGHLYQGRYKSFVVSSDEYFLRLCRYVERNALRGNLVKRAEDWRWSSLWNRMNGIKKNFLKPWPVKEPSDYLDWVNEADDQEKLKQIRTSVLRSAPLGNLEWAKRMVKDFGLETTIRPTGRPKKGS